MISKSTMLNSKDNNHVNIDLSIFLPALFLISIGIVMISSSSLSWAQYKFNEPLFWIKRHTFYVLLSLTLMFFSFHTPVRVWRKYSFPLLMFCIVLLVIVLLPGIGIERNGSQRWINVFGFTLQVSEWIKLSFIAFVAHYLADNRIILLSDPKPLIPIFLIFFLISFLLILEPDFGSFVLLGFTLISILFISGIKLRYFLILSLLAILSFWLLAESSPYRLSRITSYLDPWSQRFSSGYQLTQALIAFGRGEWFGVGLGHSVQKMLYLPEAHTDFVFAIFAEEFGFFGVLILVGTYCFLIFRILSLSWFYLNKKDYFSGFFLLGVGTLFAGQTFINLGVNSGLLPTKGLTLPFLSYGGNSLLVSCIMLGIVLRLASDMRESKEVGK